MAKAQNHLLRPFKEAPFKKQWTSDEPVMTACLPDSCWNTVNCSFTKFFINIRKEYISNLFTIQTNIYNCGKNMTYNTRIILSTVS